jgi:hypothetical protein
MRPVRQTFLAGLRGEDAAKFENVLTRLPRATVIRLPEQMPQLEIRRRQRQALEGGTVHVHRGGLDGRIRSGERGWPVGVSRDGGMGKAWGPGGVLNIETYEVREDTKTHCQRDGGGTRKRRDVSREVSDLLTVSLAASG